jgi:hypothetical protein
MSLVSLGAMMASEIRVSGASVQRDVPRLLFQSFFVGGSHINGQSHAYAVSRDGQRFLISQFDNFATGFGRGRAGGVNAAAAQVIALVTADRHASTTLSPLSTAPITVVLDWTAALKR